MKVKGIIFEDFVNYKKASITIAMPYCTFKCNLEAGKIICHNSELVDNPIIEVDTNSILKKYIENPITHSVVFQGLEPLDSFGEVYDFIKALREDYICDDDIVIYTGYTEDEAKNAIDEIKKFKHIIVKYGRFKEGYKKHYDEILGVYLASDNQYAKIVS